MEKIKTENLTFCYPDTDKKALDNINITINSGEFVVICGKSGCGKSTFLRMLKPLIAPNGEKKGTVYFNGTDVSKLTQREQAQKIGFIMQNPDNQIVCDKVWHELAFGLENLGVSNDRIRARVAETAAFFGIESIYHKNISELSGGQKQLVNLAAVTVMQPEIIVLDEPSSQLDPIAAHSFFEMLSRMNRELGITVVLSEHRLEEVFHLADKVVVLEHGKIIAQGTPPQAAQILSENKNGMLDALPSPVKIYYRCGGTGDCPLSVRGGKEWLENREVYKKSLPDIPRQKGNTAVSAENVWFKYEKEGQDVLSGFSVNIYENEFYALVGGNGAGKSTFLSLICGINKPYCGKIKKLPEKTTAMLPQNPSSIFSHRDLKTELDAAAAQLGKSDIDIKRIISLCELEGLLSNHPFDLSGGEQQRAALALVLLSDPDILILDEPTKGTDACFKLKLADIIKNLKKGGKTVIMVSHDIEFCAKYADCVGMVFDGQLISENTPRSFFADNRFYTTGAAVMSRGIIENAVTDSDIISALGFETAEKYEPEPVRQYTPPPENEQKKVRNIPAAIIFALLFASSMFLPDIKTSAFEQILSIMLLGLSCINIINTGEFEKTAKKTEFKIPKAFIAAVPVIAATVAAGQLYRGGRRYYLISLLVIIETILAFFVSFERKRPTARHLAVISVFCAIAVAGRTAFAAFPQFKPISAIVIIAGISLGAGDGFLVGAVSAFVSNFFFVQGPWTPWQMISFGIIGFFAGLLFDGGLVRKTRFSLCAYGFIAVFAIYGGIMNFASAVIFQPNLTFGMVLASYAAGVSFDLVHAVSTVLFLWFAARPMYEKVRRIKKKYGLD